MAVIKTLKDGRYRILTTPYQGREHIFGNVISIGCVYPKNECPLCIDISLPSSKPYWLLYAIDRSDNTSYVYKLDYGLFRQIQSFAKDYDWGNPTGYDIEIKPSPTRFLVFAKQKIPLSAHDKLIADNIDKDYFVQYTKPWLVERIEKTYKEFQDKLAILL